MSELFGTSKFDKRKADLEQTLSLARTIGTEHGRNAGSWIVDGNSSTEALKAVIQAAENCDLDIPSPLSEEWADGYTAEDGYTIDQLRDDCGVGSNEDSDLALVDDLATAYEAAYYQAYEAEAVRSARAMLPEDEEETR